MAVSGSNMGFRQRLLDMIDRSGGADTVRNMRRDSSPRLDSLKALCRVLGFRLEMVPLNGPVQPPAGEGRDREAA